jgi:hypothetical protein
MTCIKYMQYAELMAWRSKLRRELLARRQAVPADRLHAWRTAMDRHLQFGFPGLAKGVIAFCWPIRNEYDARHLIHRLRQQGATAALPVVVAPKAPLIFREWHPGVELAMGKLDIPIPRRAPGGAEHGSAADEERLRPTGLPPRLWRRFSIARWRACVRSKPLVMKA